MTTIGTTGMTLDQIEAWASECTVASWRPVVLALCAELRAARAEAERLNDALTRKEEAVRITLAEVAFESTRRLQHLDLQAARIDELMAAATSARAEVARVANVAGEAIGTDPPLRVSACVDALADHAAKLRDDNARLNAIILRECQDQAKYEGQLIKALGVDPASDTYGGEFAMANLVGLACDRIADLERQHNAVLKALRCCPPGDDEGCGCHSASALELALYATAGINTVRRQLATHYAIRHGLQPSGLTAEAIQAARKGYDSVSCEKCCHFMRVSSGGIWACEHCGSRGELPDPIPVCWCGATCVRTPCPDCSPGRPDENCDDCGGRGYLDDCPNRGQHHQLPEIPEGVP